MYLALMEGDDPANTKPVLMTRDRVLLEAFADALEERIRQGTNGGAERRALELIHGEEDDRGD